MDKKKFDKIMNEWVAHEMKAAPDLNPSPEVYQKLEDREKRSKVSFFSWPVRLAAAGIAAALIILVIVMQPPKEMGPIVGLRKGTVAEKAGRGESSDRMQVLGEAEAEEQAEDVVEPEKAKRIEKEKEGKKEERAKITEYNKTPAKTKVAEKETLAQPKEIAARPRMEIAAAAVPLQIAPERIEFQYQPKGSESILGLDISLPQDEIISLSSEDNYRLILQLPQERYVYIYQFGADEQLTRLFPNTEYHPAQNPLQAGKTIIIPLPPNWFYVEKVTGEVLIYVVTSAEPLQDWDELYADYSQTSKTEKKQKISVRLLDRIQQDKQKPDDQVSVRVFKFNVHGSDRIPLYWGMSE